MISFAHRSFRAKFYLNWAKIVLHGFSHSGVVDGGGSGNGGAAGGDGGGVNVRWLFARFPLYLG